MWEFDWTYISKNQRSKVRKKHRDEFEACLANLESLRRYLEMGLRVGAGLKFGFFRSEGDGLYRVGQSGVPSPKETRIYICIDEDSQTIFIVGLGFKEGQKSDIKEAKIMVRRLRKKK